jgi:hypothetical protein
MRAAMIDALAPLRERMPKVVREQEILRVAVNLPSQSGAAAISEAQRQVLAWAQRRSGGKLPKEAWGGAGFVYLAGGRTRLAVRLSVDRTEIWTLRADDPDKTVAGRIWTTEITIGRIGDATPRLSVRLLASTPEEQLDIDPHVPGFLRQLATDPGLQIDDLALRSDAWRIGSAEEVNRLIALLENPARQLPVFVASGDERSDHPDKPLTHLIHRGLGIDLRERRPQFPDAAFRRYAGTDCLGAGG